MTRMVALFCLATSCILNAATSVSFSLAASTGDDDFDLTLRNINCEARESLPSYYSSMRISFGASSANVDRLLYHHGLSPADAFMVFRLSIMIGKPIDYVVLSYKKHKGHGWGAIAKSLGIKPGSPEFHQLKKGGIVVLDRSKKERAGIEVKVQMGNDNKGQKAGRGKKAGGGSGKKGKGKKK